MHTKTNTFLTILGLCSILTACDTGVAGIRDELGLKKEAPDEFRVVKRAPLEMPTDYNLPVPRPGEARPQEPAARDLAKSIIAGKPVEDTQAATSGEKALLNQAGAENLDPGIRYVVDKEDKESKENRVSVMEKLGIRDPEGTKGSPVDPFAEADKLEQDGIVEKVVRPVPLNDASGQPVDTPPAQPDATKKQDVKPESEKGNEAKPKDKE